MPHGHCYLWQPGMVWLQAGSNLLIGLSYVSISLTLAYLVYRVRDLPFEWLYIAFGIFIISCGFTHFMEIVTLWRPYYWIDGALRSITALASLGTALVLPPLIPKAVALAHGAKAAHDRGIRLESAYQQLGEVFEKTKELDELKTQFFANVSHELRTPLSLILGPAERMLKAPNITDDQRHDLDVMKRNARTLLKHVNDLLDVAKLEAGKMKPAYARVNFAKLARIVSGNFDGIARERNIELSVIAPDEIMVEVDTEMLQRVLFNLLSNAFKFVPKGGKVLLKLEPRISQMLISVEDSGPGIAKEFRETVFERFRQVEGGATRKHGGTGLGLSIVKDFIEIHRAKINVQTSTLGGALFQIEIPLKAPSGTDVSQQSDALLGAEQPSLLLERLDASTKKVEELVPVSYQEKSLVLVVEDNIDMNRFVCEILASNYRVVSAFNGQEGIQKAQALIPDLILSDIMMPIMSGDQMLAALRTFKELQSVPIILLTAKADDELKNMLLRTGAQDYIVKPFSAEEVNARVHNLITMKRAREALQKELLSQTYDLEALAREITLKQRDLQRSAEDLKVAKEKAELSDKAKTTFLGIVSHELKTPMTSFKLQLDLLKRLEGKNFNERQSDLIDRIGKSADRSIELMENLLEFTRLQSGTVGSAHKVFGLKEAIVEVIESLQPIAESKGIRVYNLLRSDYMPILDTDRTLVMLILQNLVSNAIKYTDKGDVKISGYLRGDQHCVSVQDTGPGIPKDKQKLIFEPFEQLTALANKSKPGFGLGLSIVHESAIRLGAKIMLESEPNQGSTFTVLFPTSAASESET